MSQSIENPSDCGVFSVVCFLNTKDRKAAEIVRNISEMYEENITSEGMVRKWVRAFKDGRMDVHDEERSGRPGCRKLMEKFERKRSFMISSLFNEFPQVSRISV
ncbi:hypothetical protein AVEN_62091-1 [Araneus ventricosus]|uniref:Mos1 transposase HTH domain-containing protein n=1 Tax=Araneus ventricosus TaxID=182803 RepID=A0A4Y2QSQ0_ARAVE|nr:hypothetical protein AVEN_62091-1 [Araneus ventricosus]